MFKVNKNNEIHIFIESSNIKKDVLKAVNQIRSKYVQEKIYLEMTYDTAKNTIEIKARKKDFNDIVKIFNEIFKNLILSTIQFNTTNSELNGDKCSNIDLYKESKESISCQICLETLSDKNLFILSYCGDVYCKECIKNIVLVQINAQPVADLPLRCSICQDTILNSDRLF